MTSEVRWPLRLVAEITKSNMIIRSYQCRAMKGAIARSDRLRSRCLMRFDQISGFRILPAAEDLTGVLSMGSEGSPQFGAPRARRVRRAGGQWSRTGTTRSEVA